ncbi:MAG TPA: hypothetical protein VM166_05060 [Gemmatimonadaceae bacterium]|nr:hypothetical protein [Gemmatimonadaceae bacterium]
MLDQIARIVSVFFIVLSVFVVVLITVMLVRESFGKWRDANGKRIIPPGLAIILALVGGAITSKAFDLGTDGAGTIAFFLVLILFSVRLAD